MELNRTPTLIGLEHAVLRLSATGLLTDAVADRLGMSTHQVRRHLVRAMAALGARSKLEAVVLALELGLITLPGAGTRSRHG